MAKEDEKNIAKLPGFSVIKGHERRAVILRAEGKTIEQITAHINNEFALEYAVRTVQEWFGPGGRLEQAHNEYNEAMAEQSLRAGRQIIKKATSAAAANLVRKIASADDRVSLDASKALLNKYVPDKQVQLTGEHTERDLPPEIAKIADEIAQEEAPSEPQPDDTPEGSPDSPQAE